MPRSDFERTQEMRLEYRDRLRRYTCIALVLGGLLAGIWFARWTYLNLWRGPIGNFYRQADDL